MAEIPALKGAQRAKVEPAYIGAGIVTVDEARAALGLEPLRSYVIDIPDWHPTPLNKLLHAHWGTASKRKRADREMVWAFVKAPGRSIPNNKVKRSVELTITLAPAQRACDGDAYWKSLLDALVKAHALWNDSPAWCELLPVKFERGERKATRILLRDIA